MAKTLGAAFTLARMFSSPVLWRRPLGLPSILARAFAVLLLLSPNYGKDPWGCLYFGENVFIALFAAKALGAAFPWRDCVLSFALWLSPNYGKDPWGCLYSGENVFVARFVAKALGAAFIARYAAKTLGAAFLRRDRVLSFAFWQRPLGLPLFWRECFHRPFYGKGPLGLPWCAS
ncbi:hypothetical protein L195_g001955 [Trifolium pratense]|uniref:Uncharacterized protein n=1 Tax=Trifolium pratense TaxID=57577 RepID=A0A2K3NR47_TRIPR|nr:hypothetical protein L195_g001955 [Trifolium pratense]